LHITNETNLPDNFVRAAERALHRKADVSVTELEKSPREYWLTHRHDDKIYIDVSDMIWLLFGAALHGILKDGSMPNQLTEEYLTVKMSGHEISGTSDLWEDGKITDYKTTSVYTIIFDSRAAEWEAQLNVYKYLFDNAGFETNELEIVALLKDWSRSKAKYDVNYPQKSVVKIGVGIWTRERVEAYIKEKLAIWENARNLSDNDLPLCTDKERWKKESVYKCIKAGQVKSKKNFDNKVEAEAYCAENKLELKKFPGECVKCVGYCYAASFCNQYLAGAEPPVGEYEAALAKAKKETGNNA